MTNATIYEQGNGYPDVGDYVRGRHGYLYAVVACDRNITTHWRSGNSIRAMVAQAAYGDCPEGEEHSALCDVDSDSGLEGADL